MSVAIRTATRIQDMDDANVTLGVGVDEYVLTYDHDTAKFVLRAPVAAPDLSGYALLAGRAGGQTLYGGTGANDDITIHGTSNATRTTSYVILQPTAGNVGIGTIAPIGVLEAVTQIGADYPLWLTAYASDPVPGIVGRSARGTQATPTATQLNDFLFAFGGRGHTGSAFETNSQALIAMRAAEIHSGTNQGTYITFGTTPVGSVSRAEVARITSAGLVGIGTASPATALHVVGAATITGGIRPAADSTTALQLQNATGTSVLNVDTTNQRVGIGTTAPAAKTEVAVTLANTSAIANGAAVYTTTMSPSAHGTAGFRNVEYDLLSGNANEIGSGTNMLLYQYINSYTPTLVGVSISTRFGATANVIAERMLYLAQDSKVSGAAVATKTGLYIDAMTHGNTNYAIYTNAGKVRLGDIVNFAGTMGDSAKNPATDAPADWVQIEIGGTPYYIPAYAAS